MKRARHGDEMQSKKRISLTANDKKILVLQYFILEE